MESNSRIALVTGAGSGIGRAASLALQAAGYHVVLAGRRLAELDKTAALANASVAKTLAVQADVSLPDSVNALYARIKDEFGRLDVLFNNAGLNAPGIPIEDLSYETWTSIVNVNLTGAFLCAQAAARVMQAQVSEERRGGAIVNVASILASRVAAQVAPYAASKAGLLGMMKTIAAENVRRGITANAVLPGLIASERVRAMPAELYEQIESTFLPSGRMGEVAEVAALVAHLASEDAGYVTGQEIGIDGGAWLNTLSLTRQQRE